MMEVENMVEVRNAYKRYNTYSSPVLHGLNMTVEKGSIYGLLGPSGCGKTTLLSCIVGRKRLDHGRIHLGIFKRSDIGYMPQDIALFQDFTISEILYFFGTLFALPNVVINKRFEELQKMLELPSKNRFVKTLSGGQQRRVSFAVALLHDPKLLILDEPTVGVDPLLCHNIWQYLMKIVRLQKKTIIITTHYIEEARQCNRIGLMRGGVLLSEASPEELMANYQCSSLEEVFLQLSKQQHESNKMDTRKGMCLEYPSVKPNSAPSSLPSNEIFIYSRFVAQIWKNFKWTKRNIPMLVFILILPAIQSYLFCISFGHDPTNIPVAMVSDEFQTTKEFTHRLCDDLMYNVTYSSILECNIPKSFTCQFWKLLKPKMNVIFYTDLDEAKVAVSKNKVWGLLYVAHNFTTAIEERIGLGLSSDEFTLESGVISVWLDMSNYIISHIIKRDLAKCLRDFVQNILESCGILPKVGDIPIKFNDAVYGSNPPVFAHSSAASFICSFIFYFTLVFTSGAIKMENLYGLVERSRVAGMTMTEIVSSHLIVQFCLMTLQTSFMMLVMYVLYDNPLKGDIWLSVTMLYFVAFVGISMGYFLAEICEQEKLISYAGVGLTTILLLINGCVWPMEGSHFLLKSAVRFFPIVPAIEGYNSIVSRGFDLRNKTVVYGYLSCSVWIFVLSLLTYYFAKRKK